MYQTLVALWLVLLLSFPCVQAQEPKPTEYQLKAAFIYHFAQFVSWPATNSADTGSPFVIGVLGENPFGPVLEQAVHGKTLNEHPLMVKDIRSLTEANHVQILFISSSEKKRFQEIFAALADKSVLTVGEADTFLESGGIINFVREGTKIHFQINEQAAKNAHLKISSKLLTLGIRKAQ
jgi:hypothetical protein